METDQARALTLDGNNWELQYRLSLGRGQVADQQQSVKKHNYVRVAVIRPSGIKRMPLPHYLAIHAVEEQIRELAAYLEEVSVPLPPADMHEYWLLDEADKQPLALIYSCLHAEEMPSFPHRPEWTATPAAIMEVPRIPEEQRYYVPPVNYRLEHLVNERAGRHPTARWIRRREGLAETFPSCLVREDWENEEDRRLCQRYIERQAPRLLMLHGLEHEDRLRLEGYARQNALEVERFFPLYPAVADDELMSAICVEARLRLAAERSGTE
ncbi:MAG: hypothetical protein PVH54_12030 [Gammaproteobacteria bacterium]